MKKYLKILLIVVAVVLVAGLIYYLDGIRVLEETLPEATAAAESIGGKGYTQYMVAYSIVKEENKVIITIYGNEELVKAVTTYSIENDIVVGVDYEKHMKTKFMAKNNMEEGYTIKDNVLYGKILQSEIGKNINEIVTTFREKTASAAKLVEIK